jgi:hypothetical protein
MELYEILVWAQTLPEEDAQKLTKGVTLIQEAIEKNMAISSEQFVKLSKKGKVREEEVRQKLEVVKKDPQYLPKIINLEKLIEFRETGIILGTFLETRWASLEKSAKDRKSICGIIEMMTIDRYEEAVIAAKKDGDMQAIEVLNRLEKINDKRKAGKRVSKDSSEEKK